jgi:hypothetical protein
MALKLTSHPFRPDTVALPQDWRCSGEAHQAERLRTECEASRRDGTIWRFKMNQPRSAVSLSLSLSVFLDLSIVKRIMRRTVLQTVQTSLDK